MKKKITYRTFIDDSIFDEFEKKYPSSTKRTGMQAKQTVDHVALPGDFDFDDFQANANQAGVNAAEAFFELNKVLAHIANAHGYWIETDKVSVNFKILDFLVKFSYLAILSDETRITSKYSIREYELSQSARKASRTRLTKPAVKAVKSPKKEEFELDFSNFEELTQEDGLID